MAFARGRGEIKYKTARVRHEPCVICHKPIIPGEVYLSGYGGTNINYCGLAHRACLKSMK